VISRVLVFTTLNPKDLHQKKNIIATEPIVFEEPDYSRVWLVNAFFSLSIGLICTA